MKNFITILLLFCSITCLGQEFEYKLNARTGKFDMVRATTSTLLNKPGLNILSYNSGSSTRILPYITCSDQVIDLNAISNQTVTYNWSGPSLLTDPAVNPAQIFESGWYKVTVTNTTGGTNIDSIFIGLSNNGPTVTVSVMGKIDSIPAVTLMASVTTNIDEPIPYTYSWTGGGTSQFKTVTATGDYTVNVQNQFNGCSDSESITVNKSELLYGAHLSGSLTDGAPTAAQINSITGLTPSIAGSHFFCYIKDTDGTALVYLIESDGSAWHYEQLTQAL